MGGQRPACQKVDLQRANQTLSIAWLNALARVLVEPPQHAVQRRTAALVGNCFEAPAQRGAGARAWKEPPGQRSVIETCAAHEDRKPAATMNVGDNRGGVTREP